MSYHTTPEPDRPDRALARRSDIYVARHPSRNGIIDAEPLPQDANEREFPSGDSAARETHTTPVPTRIRKQSPANVDPPPYPQPPRVGLMDQFADYLTDEFDDLVVPQEADQDSSTAKRIIKVSLIQDHLGTRLTLFISHGARPLLLSLVIIVLLLAMGKLSDALEILIRFVF